MAGGQVSVRINGEELDIFDSREFPLSLDYQIEDIVDFTSVKGSGSSKSFKVPSTVKNDKIFNLFGSYSVISNSIKIFTDVEIFYDGIPISTGSAILKSSVTIGDRTRRKASEYELLFLLDNTDWFYKMRGRTLNQLSFTDHDYTVPNLDFPFWDGDLSFSNYGYTLIKWKNFVNESLGYITYTDLTPFLYLADIIEKSFASIGYTVDSSFLSSSFARRLIMPIPLRQYGEDYKRLTTDMRGTTTAPFTVIGALNNQILRIADDSTAPNFDIGGNFNTLNFRYFAPLDGSYRFRAECLISNITVGSPPDFWQMAFTVNGGPGPQDQYELANNEILSLDAVITLSAGDYVEVRIVSTAQQYDISNGLLEVNAVYLPYTLNQSEIVWEYLNPKYLLTDIISGVAQLFNLYIFADSSSKVVRIETRKNFFDQKKDYTDSLDISKDGSKVFKNISLRTIYEYIQDSNDDTVSELNDNRELGILSGEYLSNNPLATGVTNIENSFFASTAQLKAPEIAGLNNTDTAPQIPVIYPVNYLEDQSETETDFDFEPRILYHKGRTTFNALTEEPSPEGTISFLIKAVGSRFGYPKSFVVNYDDQTGTDPNLSFSRETLYTGVTVPGLLEVYFLDHLASLNNGIQVTDYIRYKITDILSLNFREKYFISGVDYILQKIDKYTPVTGRSTKVILLEDICASQSDLDSLIENEVQDIIRL